MLFRSYEQRGVRNPVDNKYRENRTRIHREIKTEIAVADSEPQIQTTYTEEKPIEKKVEVKPENSVVKQPVVSSSAVISEVVAPKKPEKVERFEEKPVEDKKLRIAVARRKLNF